MTELWVKKLPTDVHRLVDNKLPEGSKCTGVAMTTLDDGAVEEYVATINGQEVIVQGPAEESADDVADRDRRARTAAAKSAAARNQHRRAGRRRRSANG